MTAAPLEPDLDSAASVNKRIEMQVKTLRDALKLTQSEFGARVGAQRFTINKIERGNSPLRSDMAKALDKLAHESAVPLAQSFEALVAQRTRIEARTQTEPQPREVVTRMLQTPSLNRIVAVLADDLDFAELLGRAADHTGPLEVRIVVPSAGRIKTLLGDGDPASHLINHVNQQALQLWRLAGVTEHLDMSIIESEMVTAPLLVAQTPRSVECAYWPALPASWHPDPKRPPVRTSVDPQVVGWSLLHIEDLTHDASPVIFNEALARLSGDSVRFTRFVKMGPDVRTEEGEGYAVALVLPYAETADPIHGVCRRALLDLRQKAQNDPDRESLIANKVEEVSLSEVIDQERDQADPSWDTQASTIRMFHALVAHGDTGEPTIPREAFEAAAKRELRISYGLEVARLEHHPLPDELRMIHKDSAADIIPCLFSVNLDLESDGGRRTSQLTSLLQAADPNITELGYEELLNPESERALNDFLGAACRHEWFKHLLVHELGLGPR